MPRYLPNLRFSDCWSSIGNITFFHIDGRCYWRTRPRPVFPGTPGQIHQLDLHRRALAAWRTISSEEQNRWNSYAKDVPSHRPPYDNSHHITGHNLFVSAYHGFAQLGDEHVPVPMPYPDFPVASIFGMSAVADSNDMQLICQFFMDKCSDPERYRFAARIQLTHRGGGLDSGLMRSFMSTMQGWVKQDQGYLVSVRLTLPDYQDIWQVSSSACTVHMRGRLIDSITGYRGNVIKWNDCVEL